MIKLEIRSAAEQRVINEVKKQEQEQQALKRREEAVESIFNYCKEQIENSSENRISFILTRKRETCMDIVAEVLPIVQAVLEEAGYHLVYTLYSRSWYEKSGRFASCTIEF